jgi:hypothetical protein
VNYSCGRHGDGTLTCWGPAGTLLTALNAESGVDHVTIGNYGACVLRGDGSFFCHGSNTYGFQGINGQSGARP